MKAFGFSFGFYGHKTQHPPTQKQLDYIDRLLLETGTSEWRERPKTIDEAGAIIERLITIRDGASA